MASNMRMGSLKRNPQCKLKFAFIISCLLLTYYLGVHFDSIMNHLKEGSIIFRQMNGWVERPSDKDSSNQPNVACSFPNSDPFNPVAMQYFKKHPTTKCDHGLKIITFYDGVKVHVNNALRMDGLHDSTLECRYRNVSYSQGPNYYNGKWVGPFSDSIKVEGKPEFVEVECRKDRYKVVSKTIHYIIRTHLRAKEKPRQHKFAEEQMNVLLIGIDSLSAHLFKRAMPETRSFLLDNLDAVEMNLYNKVGDNTFPNLLAIATGKFESDLKKTGWNLSKGFDDITFLWDVFKEKGYRTQYMSDRVDFDDFVRPPTDSFNYPMVISLMKDKVDFDNDCFEDQIEVKLWLDLVVEFARESLFSTGRFFSLGMVKRPTHDFPDKASAVDMHYLTFLKTMFESNLLNNTFLVFFGDHGLRISAYRRTFSGSIEERMANMVLYVPMWFRKKYPWAYQNLMTNADRLTTNFDIHTTVESLSDMNTTLKSSPISTRKSRGLNLFFEVPKERNCEDAEIPPHFCLCGGGIPVLDKIIMHEIAEQAVKDINNILQARRDVCAALQLKETISLVLLAGSVGRGAVYRVMFVTTPGDGAFEATVSLSVHLWVVKRMKTMGMISRINLYKGQSVCVQEDKHLKLYCFCKDILHAQIG